MESTDVLVVLLSIGMSIVLLLTIVALFLVIKVLRTIKMITDKADHIAENVDMASEFFKKTAGPAALGKLLANIFETVKKHSEDEGRKGKKGK